MDDKALFERLLHADGETEADEILTKAGFGLDNEDVWQPLGGMENNFSTVGNQQSEPTGALVEKIINGIDAVLMAECFKLDIAPDSSKAPLTMSAAVERFFKIKGGSLSELGPKERTALAKRVSLVAVGEKSSPSYLIIDDGEGQTPDAFPDTFLSLNKSNKLRIPFVQGKFNSGGTGVLQFCGERNIQLIASRRHASAPVASGDQSRDLWGFTIVRRMKPTAGRRNSMYVYLAPDKKVPRFAADKIDVYPQDRTGVVPEPYKVGLSHGSCVKLYNFRWKPKSIATTDARYELERFLHSPCLPIRVTETRKYNANYFSTTVAGVWATMAAPGDDDGKVEAGFPAYADLEFPGVGHLPYQIAVFTEKVDPKHFPHGVFFTVNGQVHGGLPADFITRQLKLDYLKDHLLVSVDCTSMDSMVREDFFMASRDRLRKNDVYDMIVDRLKEVLRDHAGLRQLNALRRKKEIEEAVSDEKETANLFDALLKADPLLASLFHGGDRLITSTGPGPAEPYVGSKFPTFFRLTRDPLVKHCPINWLARVEFETDVVNDYFKRTYSKGALTVNPPNIIEHSHLWNGRFVAMMRIPAANKVGDEIEVTLTVEDEQTAMRGQPFVSKLTLIAEEEREPPKGGHGKGKPDRKTSDKSSKRAPTLAIPEILWKEMDPDIGLQVRHDDEGGHEFFVNTHNKFLLTELMRAKEEEHALIRYWFKYGLALCALGMLHDEREREEARKRQARSDDAEAESGERETADTDDALKRVNQACVGLARVIIPVVRALNKVAPD